MIEDFLPKYPLIDSRGIDFYPNKTFNQAIYEKKEFYENKLDSIENFPLHTGLMMKHQTIIARYLASETPYNGILLVHAPGTGKTCSAISAIETIKESSFFKGAIIVAKGKKLIKNFKNELLWKCTQGQYIPEDYKNLSEITRTHRINKMVEDYYSFHTMAKFAKRLKQKSDQNIVNDYSNKVIVIDEVHNLRLNSEEEEGIDNIEMYRQYHRLLHLVQNAKIILMSGTPMKDTPDEIATVMNLILPMNKQLPTGKDFVKEYMQQNSKGKLVVSDNKKDELKKIFKGRVSYLREMSSDIKKNYIGQQNYEELGYFIVDPITMSKFQTEHYMSAFEKDKSVDKRGFYSNSRQASLFIFPDGSYGEAGFKKYLHPKNHRMNNELKSALADKTDKTPLKNLSKYSAIYAQTIKLIQQKNRPTFVYSALVEGSGAILFSKILELAGYTHATGNETTTGNRYILLTGDVKDKNIDKYIGRFNRPDNVLGDYIKVIIGSKAVSEGFSFKHIQLEVILTPHFNYSETTQALARGLRLDSHRELLQKEKDVAVDIYQPVSIPKNQNPINTSVDYILYKISEDKDVAMQSILRIILESSFDCALTYLRNKVKGVDGSRECQYTTCNYSCDGITLEDIDEKKLDDSTYNLYYFDAKIPTIIQRILDLLKQNATIKLETISHILLQEYTDAEVENALLYYNNDGNLSFNKLIATYPFSNFERLILKISDLFRQNFSLKYSQIKNKLPEYSDFEILKALNEIITKNIIIRNKYNFNNYLYERNNTYFLLNKIGEQSDVLSVYYTENVNVFKKHDIRTLLEELYNEQLPNTIKNFIENVKNKSEFNNFVKTLSKDIHMFFIKASIQSKEYDLKDNIIFRDLVLEYFSQYIKHIDDTWYVTMFDTIECFSQNKNDGKWRNCPSKYLDKLREDKKDDETKIINGIGVKYNPTVKDGVLCIIDYTKNTNIKDMRKINTGKVCKSWTLIELVDIVVNRLKIEPPKDFVNRSYKKDSKILQAIENDSKLLSKLYPEPEKLSSDELKRISYWGLSASDGGVKSGANLCNAIKEFFESQNKLVIDHNCGISAKDRGGASSISSTKEKSYKVIRVSGKDNIKTYRKSIEGLILRTLNVKYRISEDDYNRTWLLVQSGKSGSILNAVCRYGPGNKYFDLLCINAPKKQTQGVKEAIVLQSGGAPVSIVQINTADPNYKSLDTNFLVNYSMKRNKVTASMVEYSIL